MTDLRHILCCVALAGASAAAQAIPVSAGTNVALQGAASQSSTGYDGLASFAIDGNTDGVYWSGSVSHTADGDTSPWWMVELVGDHAIDNVTLYNRTDCCTERLRDFTVELLNDGLTVASQHFAGVYGTWGYFEFDGVMADAVRIRKDSVYLGLAEVQVHVVAADPPDGQVPEPASLLLALAAALAVPVARRRTREATRA